MSIAIVHGGPLLGVTRLWWPALDAVASEHKITEVWHGGHTDDQGHLAGADLGIDAWARCAGHRVAIFPAPVNVYADAGLDLARALTRRIKDWLHGDREYRADGPSERGISTKENLGLPRLVVLLPGDSWTSLLGKAAAKRHMKVVRVPMVRDPDLPAVVNGHHYRDLRADAKGLMPDGRVDHRPPLPEPWIYVGREYGGRKASPLGNPFSRHDHGDDAIPLYKRHLWAKMKGRDPAVLRALGEITPEHHLVCWCVNQQGYGQCHAHVVAAAWDWWRNEGA